MKPIGKNQSIAEYVGLSVRDVLGRMEGAMNAGDTNAAWKILFKTICDEGDNVQNVSPLALMIYLGYVVAATTFLENFPDRNRSEDLILRIGEDVRPHTDLFLKIEKNFTNKECATIAMSLSTLKEVLDSLLVQYKKSHV